jgi:hypothetical protein
MKVGDLVKHVDKGWWGIIVQIEKDPRIRRPWFTVYCSEIDWTHSAWGYELELVV